jgi:hypothetical protein
MIEHHQFFRKVVPDLHLADYGVDPTQVKAGKDALGLIDAWAPHLTVITDKVCNAIKERRAKYGEKFWAYTCGEGTDPQGNYSPYILYNRPYIAARMQIWFAWHFQMDGFLSFMLSGVPESDYKPNPGDRWPRGEWLDGGDRGCGTLIYPGPNYELIPGMRLANCRDGMQDFEYFVTLRNEAKKLDAQRDAALLARVNQALVIEPDIITSVYVWTKDRNRLEAKRAQLAGLIAEVRAAVTGP